MPQVGFELTIQVFEWAKMVHALNRAATVIGLDERSAYDKFITLFNYFLTIVFSCLLCTLTVFWTSF
jgi:hypothetical protein